MYDTIPEGRIPIKLWTQIENVEAAAVKQLINVANLPWAFHHIAVMPDCHFGKGCTVGSVIAMKNAISPAAVGVDIGCGVAAVQTNLTASMLPDSLRALRGVIEATIPVGFNQHTRPHSETYAVGELFKTFEDLDPYVSGLRSKALSQVGTLGSGNHFIELCLDTEDRVWMMLHSGSRNIGKTLAEIHIARARDLTHNADLPDLDLSVFLAGTLEMSAYRHDLYWAQRYAMLNRQVMMDLLFGVMRKHFPNVKAGAVVSCHHNYVEEEIHFDTPVMVTRKGAISARAGEIGIIPGSMGTRSYIVRGLGNPESFHSASHGAGRRMSRGAARRSFTVADLEVQTTGIECRKDEGVLDEIPGAYKDIDKVMENQRDLVEVVAELRGILCVKG